MRTSDSTPYTSNDVQQDGVPQEVPSVRGNLSTDNELNITHSIRRDNCHIDRSDVHFRVLHVDDEAEFIEMVTLKFVGEPIEIIGETSAPEAFQRISKDSKSIDCIISDFHMRDQDGLDLYQAVRQLDEDIPFIFFTSKSLDEIPIDIPEDSVTAFVKKNGPGQLDALSDSVLSILTEEINV